MASANTAWGIEIGQYEIKAIQLEATSNGVRVRDFWVKPHEYVLTDPDLSASGSEGGLSQARVALEMTLSQLATQKRLEGSPVVLSFSWMQNRGFARFTKLPPVDNAKQIQGLVRYEAEQQIPFPLDEVEWDFHSFESSDSPDVDIGIFAIQREPLEEFLALVSDRLGISPAAVTLSPVALYNAIAFDRELAERNDSIVIIDIGTSATDLIVAEGSRCWMRTFPLGGHDFTEAITNEWKQPYRKADDLKRKTATSEHAKTIMSAMRGVLVDLVGDVQKSVAFYQQQNKSSNLKNVVGLGSTLKIPGLRKFLGLQLNMEVERLDSFKRLTIDGITPSTPKGGKAAEKPVDTSLLAADFSEHTLNFAVAYGLALQGLGQASVDVNLLPLNRMRSQIWQRKQRWFAAAAGVAVAAGGLMFVRGMLDNAAIGDVSAKAAADAQVSSAKRFETDLSGASNDIGARSKNMLSLLEDREVWPFIVHDAVSAVASGNDASAITDNVANLSQADPERRQTYLRDLAGTYKFAGGKRVIEVTLDVEANAGDSPADHFAKTVGDWLQDNAKRDGVPYTIDKVKWTYTKMKVGENGDLSAEASSSTTSANTPTDAATGVEGGNFSAPGGSFTAGDGSAGNNFGGLSGKRTAGQGGTLNRPGGRLGGTGGAGGGFNAPGGEDAAASSGDTKFTRGRADAEAAPPADLEKLAPLPARPSVFPAGSTVFLGKITFEVVLAGEIAAAAPADAPVEGQ
ncbi:MAG: pilus assembly protein PilM [bacterium]